GGHHDGFVPALPAEPLEIILQLARRERGKPEAGNAAIGAETLRGQFHACGNVARVAGVERIDRVETPGRMRCRHAYRPCAVIVDRRGRPGTEADGFKLAYDGEAWGAGFFHQFDQLL